MTRHSHDLCDALKLQNNQVSYKAIRDEMVEISRKHLDLNKQYMLQQKAVDAIIEELGKRWPDFFAGNDDDSRHAVRCATAYLQQTHAAVRYKVRTIPKRGAKKKSNSILKREQNPDPDPLSTPGTRIPLVERMTRNLEYYSGHIPTSTQSTGHSGSTQASSDDNRTGIPSVTTSVKPHLTATNGAPKTTTPLPTRVHTQRAAQPLTVPSSSDPAGSEASSSQSLKSTQTAVERSVPPPMPALQINIQAIHHFLQTCLPPMDHFLYRFINAGLRTEEGLLGASRWRRELIESFLDHLPPHADGSPVLLMEKMVLMHQFQTYFL